MFHRFVAGSAIGALVIAVATLVLVSFAPALPRTWPLTTVWCFVPFAWGIWALLAPQGWLPNRLPYWGAILGFLVTTLGAFVLDLPSRIFALPATFTGRLAAIVVGTIAYYFLWMLVRTAYRTLTPEPKVGAPVASPQFRKAA